MKPLKPPYPTTQALAAMIRANDDKAVKYVIGQIKRAGGNISAAAEAIGCGLRTMYLWRDSNERLRDAFEEHGMGRIGVAAMGRATLRAKARAKASKAK